MVRFRGFSTRGTRADLVLTWGSKHVGSIMLMKSVNAWLARGLMLLTSHESNVQQLFIDFNNNCGHANGVVSFVLPCYEEPTRIAEVQRCIGKSKQPYPCRVEPCRDDTALWKNILAIKITLKTLEHTLIHLLLYSLRIWCPVSPRKITRVRHGVVFLLGTQPQSLSSQWLWG